MKKNNKGFTLAELLIVVAIIAVLVAIAIPVFTSQLEKAREATDAANIRSAYAEVMVKAISAAKASTVSNETVALKQTQAKWQNTDLKSGLKTVFELHSSASAQLDNAGEGKTATIAWVAPTSAVEGHASITIS